MLDAARAKVRRDELRISVPVGYVWHRDIGPRPQPQPHAYTRLSTNRTMSAPAIDGAKGILTLPLTRCAGAQLNFTRAA